MLERFKLEDLADLDDAQLLMPLGAAFRKAKEMERSSRGGRSMNVRELPKQSSEADVDRAYAMTMMSLFGLTEEQAMAEIAAHKAVGGITGIDQGSFQVAKKAPPFPGTAAG